MQATESQTPSHRPPCQALSWLLPTLKKRRNVDEWSTGPARGSRGSAPRLLGEFGFTLAIALALNGDDLGVMREAVDERDGTGRVWEDGVPVFEDQVRRHDDRALFVPTTDDLKQQVRRVGVIGQVSDFINGENLRARVGAQPTLERARGLLPVQIEQQVRRGDEERRVACEHRLVQQVLGQHGLAESLRRDEDDVLALGDEVEREDAIDGGAGEVLGPVPFKVRERLEAAQARGLELAFESPVGAGLEFRVRDRFEQDRRTPARAGGPREQIIEAVGGMGEREPAQIRGQGRRRRRSD